MKNLLLTFLFSICAFSLLAQNNRPEHLYIIGTLNADGSYDLVGQEFTTEDNNIYTCNGVRVYKQSESAPGPDIYITENPNASQKICYTVGNDDNPLDFTTNPVVGHVTRVSREKFTNLFIPRTGLYNFQLDFTGIDNLPGCRPILTLTEVKDGPTTDIENVKADTEATVYYNLQGLQVENPGAGIFIVVKNGIAQKVYIP